MQVPENLRPAEERKRRAARRRARRQEEQRGELQQGNGPTGAAEFLQNKRPAIMAALLVLIIVVSALLGGHSIMTRQHAAPRRAPEDRAMADLRALRVALERFRWDCRRYPTTAEGLRALVSDDNYIGWRGHYVNVVRPDPWKRAYVYRCEDGRAALFSLGPDGREGTDDDVVPALPTEADVAGPDGRWQMRPFPVVE